MSQRLHRGWKSIFLTWTPTIVRRFWVRLIRRWSKVNLIISRIFKRIFLAEPEANNPSTFYGSDNNALVYSYAQNPAPGLQWSARTQSDQNFWENTGKYLWKTWNYLSFHLFFRRRLYQRLQPYCQSRLRRKAHQFQTILRRYLYATYERFLCYYGREASG